MIDFKWKAGKHKIATIAECPAEIQVRDSKGTLQTLKRLEVTKAVRILGAQIAPVNDGKAQTAVLRKKVEDWVSNIRRKRMHPTLGWLAITTRILKGVQWPLVSALLSKKQCRRIMAPLRGALRLAGIQSRISSRIIFGSMEVEGLELPCPYSSSDGDRQTYVPDFPCPQGQQPDGYTPSHLLFQFTNGIRITSQRLRPRLPTVEVLGYPVMGIRDLALCKRTQHRGRREDPRTTAET